MDSFEPSPESDRTIPGSTIATPAHQLNIGDKVVGRYTVLKHLGRGGMGVVYKCFDNIGKVEVALKTIAPELSGSIWAMESVQENFQLVYDLHHDNIAAYNTIVLDTVTDIHYLVMEYVDGEDLRSYLRRKRKKGKFSEKLVLEIVKKIADALDYAHRKKILHRDIKPANIMIDKEDNVKLLDFGLAAQIHSTLSQVSQRKLDTSGTLPYMAPELLKGKEATVASDQYALAATVYEVFSGKPPFLSPNTEVVIHCALTESPELLENVSPAVANAVARALSKNPADRFANCKEFVKAMLSVQTVPDMDMEKSIPGMDLPDWTESEHPQQDSEVSAPVQQIKTVQEESEERIAPSYNGFFKWAAVSLAVILLGICGVGYYFFDKHQKEQARLEQIAAEEAEKERQAKIAAEKAEKERLAKLAAEKAEKERLAKLVAQAEKQGLILSAYKSIVTGVRDKSIRHCSIPNGITCIGAFAFSYCSLTSITIPNSVTSIGNYAFKRCSNLTSITIPNSVTSIGDSAFADCESLTSITIPNSVTRIGNRAFRGCESLTSINIPDSIVNMPWNAFDNIKSIIDSQNNPNFYFDNRGVLINRKTNALLAAPSYLSGNYTIPHGITSIGNRAFVYCNELTSITIPNSVTSIGSGAFWGCDNLTSITIPNSVTSIGSGAFFGCDNLTSITIPNSVTSIGNYAFQGCSNLTSITIPNSVTSIGDSAFADCESLTSITIPNSVTRIGNRAFRGCESLTSINIPDSIVNMPLNAFYDITSIIDSQNNPNFYFDNRGVLINRKTNALLAVPASWKLSGNYTIPHGITSIGNRAFEDCNDLTSITIPNSVKSIGGSAFSCCESLTSITIPNSVTSIGDSAFYRCKSLTSITIPNSVTSIGNSAFSYCESLTSITIPAHFTDEQVYSWRLPKNCRITRR